MVICALTRKGKNKIHSDDRIQIDDNILNEAEFYSKNISPKIVAIADGVGGNAGGDLAAQFVCEKMSEFPNVDFALINCELLEYAKHVIGAEDMATTYSGFAFGEDNTIFHVGNTRIYGVQGTYLKQLTCDQTTYNWLILNGKYEEAGNCCKNEIISCMGGGKDELFKPIVKSLHYSGNLLFTTDGIHDFVDVDVLESIIASDNDIKSVCNIIVHEALKDGSEDDMSVVMLLQEKQ